MNATAYRIAFLTDIHANVHALEAVLADVRRQAPDLIVIGGDLTYRLPFPRETLELLATVEYQAIVGNTERYVVEWSAPGTWPAFLPSRGAEHAAWTRTQLGERWTAHLASLPDQLRFTLSDEPGAEVLVVHGVPGNPFVGIHAPPGPDNPHSRWAVPDETLNQYLTGVRAGLILSGHTHVPLVRRWGASLIVNPGGLGYVWPGTPAPYLTRYALLTRRAGRGWEVTPRTVPYDNAAAVRGLLTIDSRHQNPAKYAALIGGG